MAVSQKASKATTGEEGVNATAEETVNEGNAGATREHANNGHANLVHDRADRWEIEDDANNGLEGGHEPNTGHQEDEEEIEPTEEVADDEVEHTIETEQACISGVAVEGPPLNATDD